MDPRPPAPPPALDEPPPALDDPPATAAGSDEPGDLRGPSARLLARLGALGPRHSLRRTRDLYLRALGAIYLCAFASWYAQQDGLVGSHGILPAADYLARAAESLGDPHGRFFSDLPTVLWWTGASDGALATCAASGLVASALLVAGLLPLPALLSCWLLYLSLVSVGGPFLRFQWDALLLEAGLTSLLLCPLALRLGARPGEPEPHPIAVFLIRLLLFKLMFLSGVVKLASGDETWRHLTALTYHYWSQPLPAWTAPFVDAAPPAVHRAACAALLAIELGSPLFVFAPRRARLWLALVPLVGLQLAIAATGTYGFFNLLTIALCLPLLDDTLLENARRRLRGRPPLSLASAGSRAVGALGGLRAAVCALAFGLVVSLSIGEVQVRTLGARPAGFVERLLELEAPFNSVNSYGLFATMTTDRLEIGLEGSDDGVHFRPYRFAWKPGPVDERPRFATPHMPRLDWQMWFAALGDCRRNQWFVLLQQRLFEGRRPVAALFAADPFPDHPPRYLRSPVWRYRFAHGAAPGAEPGQPGTTVGRWWRRERLPDFCPVLTFEGGAIRKADLPRTGPAAPPPSPRDD